LGVVAKVFSASDATSERTLVYEVEVGAKHPTAPPFTDDVSSW
jgi:hypothetical protein